jgi:hypothetical protein
VCPNDGTCVFLILPAADTECFQIFLNTLAKNGHSGDAGQAFQLKADSDSSRSRTAIR